MGRKDLKTTQPTPTTCPARNDWDGDFGVDEWHGHNMFIREDQIYRTYSIGGRGSEIFGTVWSHLDMTALGRQEEWEDSPEGWP
jgi:predicted dithiol-disulfide oxidoreductase (DUF899 family)